MSTQSIIRTYECGENISRGDVVYLSSANTVFRAQSNLSTTMPAIGIADESGSTGDWIVVIVSGLIQNFTHGFTASNQLYVSATTPGDLTTSAPFPPNIAQQVAIAIDSDTLLYGPLSIDENIVKSSLFLFYADTLDNPISSDWAVNDLAPLSRDNQNPSLYVRKFDDSDEEGVGWSISIPYDVSNITLTFKSRAATAPGSSQSVALNLYYRTVPDNGAVASWSSAYGLSSISIPTNNYYQYDEQTIALSTLGLTAGDLIRWELTRDGNSVSDTLSGDWWLIELGVAFS